MRIATALIVLLLAAPARADDGPYSRSELLAHRGVAQQFDRDGIDGSTCTASRMTPPTHPFLENTIESIAAAFRFGANRVEFDIHPTTDGEFAVFHDWRLECRTNGDGVTREKSMAYLKSLDIGHGYTADGGATFPFRGKGVGAMPTWNEVMRAFPRNRFLINIKSNDPAEGRAAVAYAQKHGYAPDRVAFSGGARPIEEIARLWPRVRTVSRARLKDCLVGYFGAGWLGHVPRACHSSVIYVPINYAGFFWGWPERFLERMKAVDSEVFVIGPFTRDTDVSGTTALDSLDDLRALPTDFKGGIVTDRIEVLGPALGR